VALISPAGYFLLAIVGGSLILGGIGILILWGRRYRARTKRTQMAVLGLAVIVLSIGASAAYVGWRDYTAWEKYAESAAFSYEVLLEPNGSGLVRLSLPIPSSAPDFLLAVVHVDPASSTTFLNTSGPEPALDIEMTGRSWVNFSMGNADPNWRNLDVNLTRSANLDDTCELGYDCSAELGMRIVQGTVASVHVRMKVTWSNACNATSWEIEADVTSGVREYEGRWRGLAC